MKDIPFFSLHAIHQKLKPEFLNVFSACLEKSDFILGQEVAQFEKAFSEFSGSRGAVGVGSGTEALFLALKALGVTAGDEVITVSNSFIATALAIQATGAKPVFVDVHPQTLLIDPEQVSAAITPKTKALLPVHLFGTVCPMPQLINLANQHGLFVVEDCAQAHGADQRGRKAGTFGQMGCFSFYPTKNLGALGDGGAITFQEEHFGPLLKTLRNYGQKVKYFSETWGTNSRLDELQAGLLNCKLPHLENWVSERRALSRRYLQGLGELPIHMPLKDQTSHSACYVFPVLFPERDKLQQFLNSQGIGTQVHYPVPIHLQKSFSFLELKKGSFPISEEACQNILSLPLYPGLHIKDQDRIIQTIQAFFERNF